MTFGVKVDECVHVMFIGGGLVEVKASWNRCVGSKSYVGVYNLRFIGTGSIVLLDRMNCLGNENILYYGKKH